MFFSHLVGSNFKKTKIEQNNEEKTEIESTDIPKTSRKKAPTKRKAKKTTAKAKKRAPVINYPRHSVEKALRIPRAIVEQNAGKDCSEKDAANYCGVGYNGPFRLEISSSLKYGLLERPSPGQIQPTELVKKILRPQSPSDELSGLREAVLKAPIIGEVYKHYRGENLPDRKFFKNTLIDTFKVPSEKLSEFIDIFIETLEKSKLAEKTGDKYRIIDISNEGSNGLVDSSSEIEKLSKSASISSSDTCFVMMPFAKPLGDYYAKIYEPAIIKVGLKPIRADNDIFGTGKIIDQIWDGINSAKVLVAELTDRNPNVYYELGLAHALKKPVVLICSNEEDVPFDLKHIRVIYYDMTDPFWGTKLIDKVAENILSALSNPNEAMLFL